MSFIAGTKVFTNSGWKKIEDVAGRDKVLVRNFIGDAEFIQPFALKKSQYNGEIVKLGGKNWSFSVTPDHIVVYDRENQSGRPDYRYEPAVDVETNKKNRIYRKFKYMAADTLKRETVVIKNEFGKRYAVVSHDDWFVLVGYVLIRGYLEPVGKGRFALNITLNNQTTDEETRLLGDILDRIGVEWSVIISPAAGKTFIRVSSKNTLASRLITRLGSSKRKEMFIPDQMIYNSTKDLARLLVETIITANKRPETERKKYYQFSTNNEKLVESLVKLGTLWGYGMYSSVVALKGVDYGQGPLKKDVVRLVIVSQTESYSPTSKSSVDYEGYVYSIDLFDGQVYVKEEGMPVWVNPK